MESHKARLHPDTSCPAARWRDLLALPSPSAVHSELGPPATCTLCWTPPQAAPRAPPGLDTTCAAPSLPPLVFSLPLLSRRKK